MHKSGIYEKYVKRILDVWLSVIALIIFSPIMLILAILICLNLGLPIVFKQPRPGKNEKIFYLYKFKSMTNARDKGGMLLPDNVRLTKFGKILRKSSLDEILELFNIIRGDMSIVGPRPLSIYYLPHYSENERKRHQVRPGLTGLAQVNGRNNLEWEERFELDITYVQNITFIGDLKIILNTIKKVLGAQDVVVRGTNSVKDFGPYRILKEEGAKNIQMDGMTYSEIGSYFWIKHFVKNETNNKRVWLPKVLDSSFTFSGRNAIEIALQDILKSRNVKKVYVPSYCCVSMLQAFIDHGIRIQYYKVSFENGIFYYDIDEDHDCDVVLVMNYFGMGIEKTHEIIKKLCDRKTIIIEDITHSLLNEKVFSEYSDYVVASIRKWIEIPSGGWVGKVNGKLSCKPTVSSNHAVIGKIEGMKEKELYISGNIREKESFLLKNSKFENDLIHVDKMLKIDDISLGILCNTDIEDVKIKRKNNAKRLLEGLKDCHEEILYPIIDFEVNTPLFVPIFMKQEDRDSLRKYLIDRGIYCPIHWPEIMGADIGIRKNELSLVCDQRYSEKDMDVIVKCIKEWIVKNKLSKIH